MLTSVADVLDRVKERIGLLARRMDAVLMTPNELEDPILTSYVAEGIREVATRTQRLVSTIELSTTAGQGYVARPPHLHVVEKADVYDTGACALRLVDGEEVARVVPQAEPTSARPQVIGAREQRLYLYPVPDEAYPLRLQAVLNGASGTTPPVDDSEPPTLDTYVTLVPTELERALVAYVTAEWFRDAGYGQAAERPAARFREDLERHGSRSVQRAHYDRSPNYL